MNQGLISTPNISPDGTKIACALFTYQTGYDIFIMNIDGSNCYPVFQSPYQDWSPTWTPDGTKVIVYGLSLVMQSPIENATDLVELIKFYYGDDPEWVINPSGGFSMSPQQKLVGIGDAGAITKTCGVLGTVPFVGKSGVRVLVPGSDNNYYMAPSFSPDGQKIAFLSTECDSVRNLNTVAVQTMNSDGTNLTQLVCVKPYKAPDFPIGFGRYIKVSLCWSPDGKKILFTAPTEKNGSHLFVINSDGSGLTQLTDNTLAFDDYVSWSK
jgi:TolB protein